MADKLLLSTGLINLLIIVATVVVFTVATVARVCGKVVAVGEEDLVRKVLKSQFNRFLEQSFRTDF